LAKELIQRAIARAAKIKGVAEALR